MRPYAGCKRHDHGGWLTLPSDLQSNPQPLICILVPEPSSQLGQLSYDDRCKPLTDPFIAQVPPERASPRSG